ncbi:MAG: TetR/AcrR family transcriptional regulator [Acidimicrobiia bacterium]
MTLTAGAGPRSPRRRRRTETAILAATLDLLGEVGFSGLTIDGIAARAGVGKATIYRHWSGKAELVVDALRSHAPPVPEPDTGDLRADLLTMVGSLVQAITRPPLARVVPSLVEAAERDPELERYLRQFGDERKRGLAELLQRASARGHLRPDIDLDVALELVIGPVFTRRLLLRKPMTAAYTTALVDLVLGGLMTPGTGPGGQPGRGGRRPGAR